MLKNLLHLAEVCLPFNIVTLRPTRVVEISRRCNRFLYVYIFYSFYSYRNSQPTCHACYESPKGLKNLRSSSKQLLITLSFVFY